MANNIPFQAQGKTYRANATVTSQTIVITADSPCNQLLVTNHQPTGATGQPVYFVVSSNASVTVTTPSNGSPQYCLISVPGSTKSYTVPNQLGSANVYIAFITESSVSECYFTPGEGL